MSCRVLTDFLARPLVVWRLEQPNQPPSCFVPESFVQLDNMKPVYLRLEEGVPGAEHYTALLWPSPNAPDEPSRPAKRARREEPQAAASAAGAAADASHQRNEEAPAKTPAQKRDLKGWEAIGDWGKYGLTREEYRLVLDTIAELTPQQAMDELHAQIPNFEHTTITLKFLKHLREEDRRVEAEKRFELQKKAFEQIEDGVQKRDALQVACPGVGNRFLAAARGQRCSETEEHWHQEFAQRFSVLKDIASSRTWSETPEVDNSLAAKAQAWMRTPSWTFCAQCGRREIQPNMHWHWLKNPGRCVARKCPGGCDLNPLELQTSLDQPRKAKRLKAYVTPQQEHWQAWVQHIAPDAATGTLAT